MIYTVSPSESTLALSEGILSQIGNEANYCTMVDPYAVDGPSTGRTYTLRLNREMFPWTPEQVRMFFDTQGIAFIENENNEYTEIKQIKEEDNGSNNEILANNSRFPSDMYSDILF